MSINLIATGRAAGNETRHFAVELGENVRTVRDFLASVRAHRPGDEYGVIAVRREGFAKHREKHEYYNPSARRSNRPETWTEETLSANVVRARARGGWSRVDYEVVVDA